MGTILIYISFILMAGCFVLSLIKGIKVRKGEIEAASPSSGTAGESGNGKKGFSVFDLRILFSFVASILLCVVLTVSASSDWSFWFVLFYVFILLVVTLFPLFAGSCFSRFVVDRRTGKRDVAFGIVFGTICIGIAMIPLAIVSGFIGNDSKLNNEKLLQSSIKTEIKEKADSSGGSANKENAPLSKDNYAVIQIVKDSGEWKLIDGNVNGKDKNESWTKEDIEDLDIVVFTNSSYKTKKYGYRTTKNYNREVEVECVSICCYNYKNGELFAKGEYFNPPEYVEEGTQKVEADSTEVCRRADKIIDEAYK